MNPSRSPRRQFLFAAASTALFVLAYSPSVSAQERGNWRAASSNAKSITGDVFFTPDHISINFLTFTIATVRHLEASEASALFDADGNAPVTGSLYRINVPGTTKFLRKNTLCGNEDATWMATYVSGKTLQLAFFSSPKPPTLTMDALANSTGLCGTFSYVN